MSKTIPDSYGISHLADHLFRAGMFDEIYHLVTSSQWSQLSRTLDPSVQQLTNDIELGYTATENKIQNNLSDSKQLSLDKLLANLTALAWLSARIKKSAGRQTPELLEVMTRLGEGEQAQRRATNIPNQIQQAESLIWIGYGAMNTNQSSLAFDVWRQADLLLRKAPPSYDNEDFQVRSKLSQLYALVGEIDLANQNTEKLEMDMILEQERSGELSLSSQVARSNAWAAVGETKLARNVILQISDADDQIKALYEAGDVQRSIYGIEDSDFLDLAWSLRAQSDDSKAMELLAQSLARNGKLDQAWSIYKENDPKTRSWIFRAAAAYEFGHGQPQLAKTLLDQSIQETNKISDSVERLVHCARLVVGTQRDKFGSSMSPLFSQMHRDFETTIDKVHISDLGIVALSFMLLGYVEEAKPAIEFYLKQKVSTDDWDETYSLIRFTEAFGDLYDEERLDDIFTHLEEYKDPWQKAEVLLKLALIADQCGYFTLSTNASNWLLKITSDEQVVSKRPNVLGPLVVWQSKKTNISDDADIKHTLDQALSYFKDDEYRTNAMSDLARSLAQHDITYWTNYLLDLTIDVMRQEEYIDPIIHGIDRAILVAGVLKDIERINQFIDYIETLNDDWIKSESLFWVAGWLAILGSEDHAIQLFHEALSLGGWTDIDLDHLEKIGSNPKVMNQVLEVSNYIGFPSTKVSVLFSGLAISISRPTKLNIQWAHRYINEVPLEYSEKRALCLEVLIGAVKSMRGDKYDICELFLESLSQAKSRDTGEVWAVLRTYLPTLTDYLGKDSVRFFWDELSRVRGIAH
jgi:hypothetical protein